MARITEIAHGIYQINARELKVNTCSAYLVVGERSAIIETGPAAMAEKVLGQLAEIGQDLTSIAYILPTHIHLDHGGGAGYLLQHLPNAQVVAHERGASHVVDPSRLIASTKSIFGEDFENSYGLILPVPAERLWTLKGGEEIDLGNRKLTVFYTPGHAPHHMSFLDSATDGLFSGEALGAYRPGWANVYPSVAPPSFDLGDYKDSMRKLLDLKPSVIFYSHDGPSGNIDEQAAKLEKSLKEFGDVVLAAMREGAEREEVERRVMALYAEYCSRSENPEDEKSPPSSNTLTDGFMLYFKRKRLV